MSKNIVGVDISDFSIEALALEKTKGNFIVEAYSRFRLSPEIVEDGRILNKEKLKEALLKMFQNAKPHFFETSRKVFLSIPESQTFSKVITVPKNIRNKDLLQAAFNKAEEFIPESPDKLTALAKFLSETADSKQVFYTSAETEVLQQFIEVFDELDIAIEGITTEAISSFKGLKKEKKPENILLLDLGARTTIASIFSGDTLCSSINIKIGGNNITEAISKKLNISIDKAEDKKRANGLTSKESGEIMLISQGQLQPLVDELKIFIDYFKKSTAKKIEKIVLIGGLSQMKGADKYFGDNLNLETSIGQPFINKESLPSGLNFSKYINVLGLARLGHQGTEIDFYKKLSKANKKIDNQENSIGFAKSKKIFKLDFKKIFTKLYPKDLSKIFISKYFWLSLAVVFLAVGIYVFRGRLWPEPPPISVEEDILVSNKTIESKKFILGNYIDFRASKVYLASQDLDLPEDFVDNFDNTLERLIDISNDQITGVINDKIPEGFYALPQIISYELADIVPTEENYVPGQELEANIDYVFMMIVEDDLKDWLIKKYPELQNKVNTLAYKIIEYDHGEDSDYFEVSVLVNQ